MKLFEKLSKKHHPEPQKIEVKQHPVDTVKYDFVERYTLVNPKNIFANHEAWALCDNMPVAYENSQEKSCWNKCVKLNTSIMLPFIRACKASPNEDLVPEKNRTVSIVHVNKDIDIYVVPMLPMLKSDLDCWLFWVNRKQRTKDNQFPKGWSFYMTPDIRKALANEIKVHTR